MIGPGGKAGPLALRCLLDTTVLVAQLTGSGDTCSGTPASGEFAGLPGQVQGLRGGPHVRTARRPGGDGSTGLPIPPRASGQAPHSHARHSARRGDPRGGHRHLVRGADLRWAPLQTPPRGHRRQPVRRGRGPGSDRDAQHAAGHGGIHPGRIGGHPRPGLRSHRPPRARDRRRRIPDRARRHRTHDAPRRGPVLRPGDVQARGAGAVRSLPGRGWLPGGNGLAPGEGRDRHHGGDVGLHRRAIHPDQTRGSGEVASRAGARRHGAPRDAPVSPLHDHPWFPGRRRGPVPCCSPRYGNPGPGGGGGGLAAGIAPFRRAMACVAPLRGEHGGLVCGPEPDRERPDRPDRRPPGPASERDQHRAHGEPGRRPEPGNCGPPGWPTWWRAWVAAWWDSRRSA